MSKNVDKRNQVCFGLGTIGRDMFYTTVSMFLMVYFTEVLNLPDSAMIVMTVIFMILRIFDAVNDPLMGVIVDNTRSKWGKFKPGMLIGGIVAAVLMVLLFTDLGLTGTPYYIVFIVCYLGWDLAFGLNDIAYWSMLPSLSTDQKVREKIGSFARTCASIGLFAVVVGIIPVTEMIGRAIGKIPSGQSIEKGAWFMKDAWFIFAVIVALLMLGFLMITVLGVKEPKGQFKEEEKTSLKEMFRIIFQNDQLLVLAISLSIFMIGYVTTTSFGVYYFKYAYGNAETYAIFSAIYGLAQLSAFSIFPLLSKGRTRKKMFTLAIVLVVIGYVVFFFSPMNIVPIGVAALFISFGQAFIQVLMLVFLTDTVEYGQWKLGKRNESVTFSVQPFINKISGALANGIVGFTLVASGINEAKTASDVTSGGITMLKVSMLLIPLALIVVSYLIYLWKFRLDEKKYASILVDLKEKGMLVGTSENDS